MIVPVALITVLMLVLIDAPSIIYAQNTNNSTPSNATTVESHPTNTTATASNTTAAIAPKPVDGYNTSSTSKILLFILIYSMIYSRAYNFHI
jgi:predicted cobalt transporter CbtA